MIDETVPRADRPPLVTVRIAATITGRGHGETQSQFKRCFFASYKSARYALWLALMLSGMERRGLRVSGTTS